MKKFLSFIILFSVLFLLFQLVSGMLVTWMYDPEIKPGVVMPHYSLFGESSGAFLIALAAAAGAYGVIHIAGTKFFSQALS
ncbi:hypothetical protein [Salibacterium aidingense]|uniref:hypothetical protein n=1 Tax=Salibacterium aidingense TaxID=384933 RepID=UPI00040BAF49|nr:hypothetical protein [Salibacterium aidingense]